MLLISGLLHLVGIAINAVAMPVLLADRCQRKETRDLCHAALSMHSTVCLCCWPYAKGKMRISVQEWLMRRPPGQSAARSNVKNDPLSVPELSDAEVPVM